MSSANKVWRSPKDNRRGGDVGWAVRWFAFWVVLCAEYVFLAYIIWSSGRQCCVLVISGVDIVLKRTQTNCWRRGSGSCCGGWVQNSFKSRKPHYNVMSYGFAGMRHILAICGALVGALDPLLPQICGDGDEEVGSWGWKLSAKISLSCAPHNNILTSWIGCGYFTPSTCACLCVHPQSMAMFLMEMLLVGSVGCNLPCMERWGSMNWLNMKILDRILSCESFIVSTVDCIEYQRYNWNKKKRDVGRRGWVVLLYVAWIFHEQHVVLVERRYYWMDQ